MTWAELSKGSYDYWLSFDRVGRAPPPSDNWRQRRTWARQVLRLIRQRPGALWFVSGDYGIVATAKEGVLDGWGWSSDYQPVPSRRKGEIRA